MSGEISSISPAPISRPEKGRRDQSANGPGRIDQCVGAHRATAHVIHQFEVPAIPTNWQSVPTSAPRSPTTLQFTRNRYAPDGLRALLTKDLAAECRATKTPVIKKLHASPAHRESAA